MVEAENTLQQSPSMHHSWGGNAGAIFILSAVSQTLTGKKLPGSEAGIRKDRISQFYELVILDS